MELENASVDAANAPVKCAWLPLNSAVPVVTVVVNAVKILANWSRTVVPLVCASTLPLPVSSIYLPLCWE